MNCNSKRRMLPLCVEQLERRALLSTLPGNAEPSPLVSSGTTLLVGFDGGSPSPVAQSILDSLEAVISQTWLDGQVSQVNLPAGADIEAAARIISSAPQVRYVVSDGQYNLAEIIPNDPQFPSQLALKNESGVSINATAAWDQTTGSASTLVAVLDSGVDYTQPDLYLSIAINQNEIPTSIRSQLVDTDGDGYIDFHDLNSLDANGNVVLDSSGEKYNSSLVSDRNGNGYIDAGDLLGTAWTNGLDNDGNGHVNDLFGWNYLANTNNPADPAGHGTHVAGIIAAQSNNGIGVAGVNWKAHILPELIVAPNGLITTSAAIAAIQDSVAQGARVINASWGEFVNDPALKDAVDYAGQHGTVFVAAAGNQANNNDNAQQAYYPASFSLPNLLSVASVNSNGNLSSFSNFGANTVSLAAPGENIISTWPNNSYAVLSGTSMATAYVTGVVSLIAGLYPDASAAWLVDRVLSTVSPLPSLAGKTVTGGMVNAYAAVNAPSVAGPRVVAISPNGDVSAAIDHVVLTFDTLIEANTFTTSDISLTGPGGTITPTAVVPLNTLSFEVDFSPQTSLGVYTLRVGPNIFDNLGQAMDQDRNGIAGVVPNDQFTGGFRIVAPPQIFTLDDGDAGFASSSGWQSYAGAGYLTDMHFKQSGSGSETATWSFTGLAPGQYRVWTTWVPYSNRVTNAPYTILDGSMALQTVTVNQQLTPSGLLDQGTSWQQLGGDSTITGGTLVVRLSDQADPGGYLIADAVRIELVGDVGESGPTAQVVAGATVIADGTGVVDLGRTNPGVELSQTFTVRNLGTSDLTLGAISIPEGFSLSSGLGTTALAPGESTTFTVQLDAGAVGSYSGIVSIATNDSLHNPFDFTVSGTVSEVQTLDDGETGFASSAGWQSYAGAGYGSDMHFKQSGSGSETATWTFTGLAPGQYRVWTTWVPYLQPGDQRPLHDSRRVYGAANGDSQPATDAIGFAGPGYVVAAVGG